MKKYLILAALLLPLSVFAADEAKWTNPDEPPALVAKDPGASAAPASDSGEIDIELLDSELKANVAKESGKKKNTVPRVVRREHNINDKKDDSINESEVIAPNATIEVATFAGGCFWCMEQPFDDAEGVISTTSGYTGGTTKNPTYEEVASGKSGHYEAVQVAYDPSKISYAQLLKIYWRNIDPTNGQGQFCDVGTQYKPAIFYHNEDQKNAIYESLKNIQELGFSQTLKVDILPANFFYPAEEYHQDYYKKNPLLYRIYKQQCGRDHKLNEIWRNKMLPAKDQENAADKKLPDKVQ